MKKVKLLIFGIIVALLLVFAFQNQTYFMQTTRLKLDLYLIDSMITPEITNAIICLSFLLLGFILSFLSSLSGRIKTKRVVKKLNKTLTDQEKELVTLKSKIETNRPPEATEALAETASPVAEEKSAAKTAA